MQLQARLGGGTVHTTHCSMPDLPAASIFDFWR
jgi:hypothetical protein